MQYVSDQGVHYKLCGGVFVAMSMEFSREIGEALRKSGQSVKSVAMSAGIQRAYLYQILNGRQQPTIPRAQRIANAVGLELRLVPRGARSSGDA